MTEGADAMTARGFTLAERMELARQAEEQVICLLLSGEVACGKEIARRLCRPVPTTFEQLRRIRARVGVRSNAQLVAVLARERAGLTSV